MAITHMKKLLLFALLLFSVTAQAASFTLSSTAYEPGTRDVTLANIITTETLVTAEFTRENWPVVEGQLINVIVLISVNGGPFEAICGFAAEGGDVFKRDGSLATKSSTTCTLPAGLVRLVNIRVVNAATINTSISLIVN